MCVNIRGTIFKIIKMLELLCCWFSFGYQALLNELRAHVVSLVSCSLGVEKVGEEEELENAKDNEELQQDDQPQRTPPGHLAEAVGIEFDDRLKGAYEGHRRYF